MNPTVRKALLFMVGAAAVTKEKVEQFVGDLQKEGALNEDEGKQLFRDLMQKGEERAVQVRDIVREEMKKFMDGKEHAYKHDMHKCCCGQECHSEGHVCGTGDCSCEGEVCGTEGCECKVTA